jgi:hypothetical protein
MPQIDQATARALTEAGYMSAAAYVELFGDAGDMGGQTDFGYARAARPAQRRPWATRRHFHHAKPGRRVCLTADRNKRRHG